MHTYFRRILGGLTAGLIFASLPVLAGAAQAQAKKQPKAQTAVEQRVSDNPPNILFIMVTTLALCSRESTIAA
jgi:hypothetical protein